MILFHAFPTIFPNGYLGVDSFFVISGFVMTPLLIRTFLNNDGPNIFSRVILFYIKRFYRLAPALGTFLVVMTVLFFFLGPLSDHQRYSMQGIYSLFIVANIGALRFNGDYFNLNPNPITHLWSLSAEEQIYFIVPLLLIITILALRNKFSVQKIYQVTISSSTLMALIVFVWPSTAFSILSLAHLEPLHFLFQNPFVYYSSFHRIFEFGTGALITFGSCRFTTKQRNFLGANCFLLLMMLLFSPLSKFKSSDSYITELSVSVLTAFIIKLETNFLKWKVLVALGDKSYSLYLYHLPFIYLVQFGYLSIFVKWKYLLTLGAIATTYVFGSFSFKKIENPYRKIGSEIDSKSIFDKKLSKTVLVFFALPLCLLVLMNIASGHRYYGLDQNPIPPVSPSSLDKHCKRDSLSGGPCSYTSSGAKKTVLLVGDSHAAMLSQAVLEAASRSGWNSIIWTHNGYPFALDSGLDGLGISNPDISQSNTVTQMRWILKHHPNLVIVSNFVSLGTGEIKIQNALLSLKHSGINFVVINETPVFPDTEFFKEPSILQKPRLASKSFPLSSMPIEPFIANRHLSIWAHQNGIRLIDPWSLFCNFQECNRYGASGWLYFDTGHLSLAGANLLRESLDIILQNTQ